MRQTFISIGILFLASSAILSQGLVRGRSSTGPGKTQSMIRPNELSAVSRAVFMPGDAVPSPDERLLAILRPEGLTIRDQTTGAVRVIVKGSVSATNDGTCGGFRPQPAWSADGAQLVYAWCFAGNGAEQQFVELRTVRADGGGDRVLYKSENTFHVLAWSPNAQDIAVSYQKLFQGRRIDRPNQPFLVGLVSATGGLRELNSGNGSPSGLAFSPDGRVLAYSRETALPRNVFLLPVDGSAERPLFPSSSHNQFQVNRTGNLGGRIN